MDIEIKKSIKPINYFDAINLLEKRLEDLHNNIDKELTTINKLEFVNDRFTGPKIISGPIEYTSN